MNSLLFVLEVRPDKRTRWTSGNAERLRQKIFFYVTQAIMEQTEGPIPDIKIEPIDPFELIPKFRERVGESPAVAGQQDRDG